MILRRIIAYFRKQEWTAIGIDFVIVVVGVLVATEVSNWNATRLMRQQGAEFSERLVTDLREEVGGTNSMSNITARCWPMPSGRSLSWNDGQTRQTTSRNTGSAFG